MAAKDLIEKLSNEVLDDIKSDSQLRAGNFDKLQKLVDDKVAPYVDFERMTRLAVGKAWRTATPQQRDELMTQFRALLVRTYSGAFTRVTDEKILMRPTREEVGGTDVIVRCLVKPSNGDGVELDYRLEKSAAGWQIYDVMILGVSLDESFRGSFANELGQGGVEGLIKTLTARNRQLAANNQN
jgi:phospholipid transport system substrate-binding protein